MYFLYNGISSEVHGIIIDSPPIRGTVAPNEEVIKIPGKKEALHQSDGTYDDQIINVFCTLAEDGDDILREKFRNITAWLNTGKYADLIFSDEPTKVYKAKLMSKVEMLQQYSQLGEFILIFRSKPFVYSDTNNQINISTSPGALYNPGTVDSEPIMKVYGSGNVTLTINGKDITVNDITEYVTIDSVIKDCYKDNILKNGDMAGDFPELMPGENTLSWTGSVTKIEITPNWRWL